MVKKLTLVAAAVAAVAVAVPAVAGATTLNSLGFEIPPPSRISDFPTLPLIGSFGGGGAVVPVVRFQPIGELAEPM